MGLSAFTDRNQPPTEEDIQKALGEKYPLVAAAEELPP